MKYIYYVIAIFLILTVFIIFNHTSVTVEVSEPAIVINDRIITKDELSELAHSLSYQSDLKGFKDAVITNELLIQEAIKQGINKEESFRQSVENYYEQSLVKLLVDRTFEGFHPVVSKELVTRYLDYSARVVDLTRNSFLSREDGEKGIIHHSEDVRQPYQDLSDYLQYSLLFVKKGETTELMESENGYYNYRLNGFSEKKSLGDEADLKEISSFLADQQKRVMFESWLKKLRDNADIKILTEQD